MYFLAAISLAFSIYVAYFRHQGLGFFDGSEYSTHILDGGIPHAPGYPLYTLIGKALLPFAGGDPFRAQFIGGLLAALGTAWLLLLTFRKGEESRYPHAALLTIFLFFSSYFVKLYTMIPEVFLLNLFLFALLLWAVDRWCESDDVRWIGVVFVAYGMGFSHHHTLALTLPAVFTLYVMRGRYDWKEIAWAFVGFGVGSLPLWYMFLASDPEPDYAYYQVNSWEDFLFMIFRKGYGTFSLTVFTQSAPLSDIFALVGKAFLRNLNYIGFAALVPLIAWGRPKNWKKGIRENPSLFVALVTLFFFFAFFVPKNNIPLTFEKYKQVVLRFVTIPGLLILYPVHDGIKRLFARYPQPQLFWALSALVLLSNVVGWRELRFRGYDILDTHVQKGYDTILKYTDPTPFTEISPQHMKCAIFTRPDALVFGIRYQNQFKTPRKCFFFTMASFSGQFRARHEEALQRMVFGDEYVPLIMQYQQNAGVLLNMLFQRLKARGFRIYLFYPTDAVVFAGTGFRYRPMGNVQELVLESDPAFPITKVIESQKNYLDEMDEYLTSLATRPLPDIVLDESVSIGLFQNMNEYRKLTQSLMPQVPVVDALDAKVRAKYSALFGKWNKL